MAMSSKEEIHLKNFWINVNHFREMQGLTWTALVNGNTKDAKAGTLNVTLGRMLEIAEKLGVPIERLLEETVRSPAMPQQWGVETAAGNTMLYLEIVSGEKVLLTTNPWNARVFATEQEAKREAAKVPLGTAVLL